MRLEARTTDPIGVTHDGFACFETARAAPPQHDTCRVFLEQFPRAERVLIRTMTGAQTNWLSPGIAATIEPIVSSPAVSRP